jgi:hypothetical protein
MVNWDRMLPGELEAMGRILSKLTLLRLESNRDFARRRAYYADVYESVFIECYIAS